MFRLILLTAFAALLIPLSANATVVWLAPTDPSLGPLELSEQHVEATIDGPAARTVLRQVFHNPHSVQLEATYVLPLPRGAQVTDLQMIINGKEVHAATLERDEARRIYDAIVHRTRDPGLIEYMDGQTVSVSIFPIPARGDMPIEIHFAQPLRRESGLFVYDFQAPRTVEGFAPSNSSFQVDVDAGKVLGTVTSPTHEISVERSPDGTAATVRIDDPATIASPFSLLYDTEATDVGLHLLAHRAPHRDEGTFLLMVSPPREGKLAEPIPKTVVFVIDTSGSMADDGKLEKARKALVQALYGLNPEDSFSLLEFSTDVKDLSDKPIPATEENIAHAIAWLKALRPVGGTNIHDALVAAAKMAGRETSEERELRQIVFMTDGLPTVGKTGKVQILRGFRDASRGLESRVFTVGFGYDVNVALLDAVAEETRAVADYVRPEEDLEVRMEALFNAISHPVLTQPELQFSDNVEITQIFPRELPDLFMGSDLMVLGRYRGSGSVAVTLTGKAAGRDYSETLETKFPKTTSEATSYVDAMWANRRVAWLLEEIQRNGADPELVEEVTSLGKKYNLVTPYTSFLTAPDEEYAFANRSTRADDSAQPADLLSARVRNQIAPLAMEESGRSAVNFSVAQKARRESKASSISAPKDEYHSFTTVDRDGVTFTKTGERWVENGAADSSETIKIEFLSDAYYALITAHPERKESIYLGDQVTLLINGIAVEIGKSGEADTLPAKLK